MLTFVLVNAVQKGIHLGNVVLASPHFVALTGVLSLSFFIHNGALSITRYAANPKNNVCAPVPACGPCGGPRPTRDPAAVTAATDA